jgi:site-specific recombinase XerD
VKKYVQGIPPALEAPYKPLPFAYLSTGEETRQMVQYRVLRASRRAKPQDGVHILRHTFCSHLAMRGAPPRAIQELAGHRELGMTQRYMHLSPAALDSAIRLLDQPFSVQSFGDILETGRVSEEKING